MINANYLKKVIHEILVNLQYNIFIHFNNLQFFLLCSLVHGSRKFIQLTRLEERNYMDRCGEFQLEFTLANIRSVFEHKFRVNQSIFNNAPKFGKMETSYYSFGGYDWSLSIYPSGKSESQLGNYFAHYAYFKLFII